MYIKLATFTYKLTGNNNTMKILNHKLLKTTHICFLLQKDDIIYTQKLLRPLGLVYQFYIIVLNNVLLYASLQLCKYLYSCF
jgi:hypothetical protein